MNKVLVTCIATTLPIVVCAQTNVSSPAIQEPAKSYSAVTPSPAVLPNSPTPIVPSIQKVSEVNAPAACTQCSVPLGPISHAKTSSAERKPTAEDVNRLEARLTAMKSRIKIDQGREFATQRASSVRSIKARQIFDYQDGAIYEVIAAVDHNTYIELQPGERIVDPNGKPSAGDTVRWLVETSEYGSGADTRVVVILKPREADLETNMAINTNRRAYYLTIRSSGATYMQAVAWNYPYDEEKVAKREEQEEQKKESIAASPDALHFGYVVKGSDVPWKPLRAFDDGVKTYIQMPLAMKSYEAPALFVIEDGKSLLVNYRVKGDYYIVDRLFDRAQLRVGTDKAVDVKREAAKTASRSAPWLD